MSISRTFKTMCVIAASLLSPMAISVTASANPVNSANINISASQEKKTLFEKFATDCYAVEVYRQGENMWMNINQKAQECAPVESHQQAYFRLNNEPIYFFEYWWENQGTKVRVISLAYGGRIIEISHDGKVVSREFEKKDVEVIIHEL